MSLSSPIQATERRLYLRVAFRLIPFLLICNLFAMIDRLNIGFAKLQFSLDLHFSEIVFGTAAAIFSIGYIAFEIPSNLMLHKYGVRKTLLRIMVSWGVVTMLLAFARSEYTFYALRFLLGAAEAGFFAGILFYLTFWFPNRYRSRAMSCFAVGLPLSGFIAGPLSGWIMTHMANVYGMAGWQWLFVLEGAPSVFLGIAAAFYLPDRPADANFLTQTEKEQISRDLENDFNLRSSKKLQSFGEAMRNPRVYGLAIVAFTFYSILTPSLIWVPTFLKISGTADLIEIGWRASLISLAGIAGMLIVGFSSDWSEERCYHAIGCGAIASAAYFLLAHNTYGPDMTTMVLAAASFSLFGFLSVFWTIPGTFLDKRAAAGGLAFIATVGNCGSAVTPIFMGWVKDKTGFLSIALSTLGIEFLLGMIVLYFCIPPSKNSISSQVADEADRPNRAGAPT